MMRWLHVVVVFLVLATACTPVVAPAGPPSATPRLEADRIIATDGAALPLRLWLPEGRPKAVILALHGFNDYSNFFEQAGRVLADRRIAAYAYDQRGFGGAPNRGQWPGTATLTADLRDTARLLRQRYPGVPLYLFGESMGGAVLLVTMGGNAPADADGVILSAPAVWGRASMPWFQTMALWMAAHTAPGVALTGRGLGIRASDNTEMLAALGRDPMVIKETRIDAVFGLVNLMDQAMAATPGLAVPSLVLYGENDQLIPPPAVAEMLSRLPSAGPDAHRLALYRQGWHMLTRDRDATTVIDDIAAWVIRPMASLPSGADRYAAEACPSSRLCAMVPPRFAHP